MSKPLPVKSFHYGQDRAIEDRVKFANMLRSELLDEAVKMAADIRKLKAELREEQKFREELEKRFDFVKKQHPSGA